MRFSTIANIRFFLTFHSCCWKLCSFLWKNKTEFKTTKNKKNILCSGNPIPDQHLLKPNVWLSLLYHYYVYVLPAKRMLPPPSGGWEPGKGYSSYKRPTKYQYMALHVSADGSWWLRGYWAGLCISKCVCLRVELEKGTKSFPCVHYSLHKKWREF
jgi:hypothetical protein